MYGPVAATRINPCVTVLPLASIIWDEEHAASSLVGSGPPGKDTDKGSIVGHDNLKTYITEYYKNLFGEPEQNDFSLNEDTTEDIPQVSQIENEFLCDEFL